MLTLKDSIQAFIHHIERERRLSPRTVSSYERDLERLRLYCETRKIPSWKLINTTLARGFVGESFRRRTVGTKHQPDAFKLKVIFPLPDTRKPH